MAGNPPTKPPAAVNGNGAAPTFPATKAQTYARPMYRPTPPKPRRRSRRGCCCACFLWSTLFILAIIFLAAIVGGIFYVIYRPRRPSFSVTTLRLAAFNISTSGQLTSRLDITVSARNPNKKMAYLYDPVDISVTSSGASIGDGSFPAFDSVAKNTTTLKATVSSGSGTLDTSTAADLKKKSSIPLEIGLETKAGVKVGGLKTKKIGVRVECSGIDVPVPKGKGPPSAPTSSNADCKAQLRIKIWKWKWYL